MRQARRLSLLLALASLSAACGLPSTAGDFGATPGGIQDMRFARDLIAQGTVPPPEAFVVEGMFSEHDLPLSGPPCERTLCLRGAAGVAPDLDGAERGWVQVGMSSRVDPARYQRPSVAIVAAVDVSGSMGWSYGEETPGALSRELLRRIAADLGAQDRVALVTYGALVATPLPFTAGEEQARIQGAIDSLGEGGSTNMEAGLRRAFELARQAHGLADEVRVLLFTDARPNVGATSPTEFEELAGAAAREGIGLTVFAMGLGVDQELTLAMSHLRGGNAFGVMNQGGLDAVLEESWPFLLHPIAYHLSLDVTTSDGARVSRGFGFPGQAEEGASLEVASVFLSRKKGALLLELDGLGEGGFKATGALSYETRDGERVQVSLDVSHDKANLDERGHAFDQQSVAKATALSLLVSGMREAATGYTSAPEAAIARMEAVLARITADAAALEDEALSGERALAEALLGLMREGAPQGDLYGGF